MVGQQGRNGVRAHVAFISEHASPVALLGGADTGGQNVYIDEVCRQLGRRGYAIDIFTRRDNLTAPQVIEWAPGVRVINVTTGPPLYCAKDELWIYMPQFRDACLQFMECNAMHYDLIHSNFWMSGWVATELGQRLHIPVVHIFHALGITKRRFQRESDTSPEERIDIEMQIIRDVDRLISSCPHEQMELVRDYGAACEKIRMIPLAVNTTIFQPVQQAAARRRLGLSDDDFVIVYVGRILPRKDIRNIIRALALLLQRCEAAHDQRSIKLLVVGGESAEPDPVRTPEIGALQALSSSLGVSRHVQFLGNRQQDELRYYYSAADVSVTTPWYEPFGLTPLESMACACPVIGSAVGGITSTIIDGETGFLVPARTPEVLAARLLHFLHRPDLKERMGQVAVERVFREFTWPIVAARTDEMYTELLTNAVPQRQAVLLRPLAFPSIVDTSYARGGE